MLLLPPPLATVLEASRCLAAGEAGPEKLQAALPGAYWLVWKASRALEQRSPGLLRAGRIPELLETGKREAEAQWGALKALEGALGQVQPAALQRAAEDLRAASGRLQEALRALQVEELQGAAFSPHPDFDLFLKIGRNVLDGHVPASALKERYPGVASAVLRLRILSRRFALLHDEPSLAAGLEGALERLEAGLGAALEFLRSGDRVALEDCLRLVGPASVEAHQALAEMEEAATRDRRYATHPLVEELFRARERALPEEEVRSLWEEAALGLEGEKAQVEGLQGHPLRDLADLDLEHPSRRLEEARSSLHGARAAGLEHADLEGLDAAFQGLREAVAWQVANLERLQGPVQGAPFFEELQLLVGLALQGQFPAQEVRRALVSCRELQEILAAELEEASGRMEPGEEEILRHLLERQVEAVECLDQWCEDGEGQHLREGWWILAEAAPQLVALNRALRQRLPSTPREAGTPCMRCGASNPPQSRYCGSCSAVLPVSAPSHAAYTATFGGGEAAPATPAQVLRLEELVHRVEGGQAGLEEVMAEVDSQLARAAGVAQQFLQQVAPRAQKDPEVLEHAGLFQEQMERYVDGLHSLRLCAEEGHASGLYAGLEACRQAGLELVALRQAVGPRSGS